MMVVLMLLSLRCARLDILPFHDTGRYREIDNIGSETSSLNSAITLFLTLATKNSFRFPGNIL